MSSVVGFASQESNGHEDGNERFDLHQIPDTTVTNLSLPVETFLRAAISLKDQVRIKLDFHNGRWRRFSPCHPSEHVN